MLSRRVSNGRKITLEEYVKFVVSKSKNPQWTDFPTYKISQCALK
jgi:hypothetical protein